VRRHRDGLDPGARVTHLWKHIWETLREWGWRHFAWSLIVGSASAFNMGGMLFLNPEYSLFEIWCWNVTQFGFPYVFMLRIADRAVAAGALRPLAYSIVVLLSVALGVWVFGWMLVPVFGANDAWTTREDFGLAATRLLTLGMGTLVYAHWRREHDTLARVRAAEVERVRKGQLVQAARLLSLQARVEPQFLFDTLGRVRDAIDRSLGTAEQLLGDLIALLRAMQPAAGATASTVAREFDLVRAYARASQAPALQPPRLVLEAEGDALYARLAPLVLLPALRSLVDGAPATGWRVGAACVGDRLRLAVRPSVADATATTALQVLDVGTLRERLNAVHGRDALLLVSADVPTALQIEVPFEKARHDDEDPSTDR
jgi:hypothetical protein